MPVHGVPSPLSAIHDDAANVAIQARDITHLQQALEHCKACDVHFQYSGTPSEIGRALERYFGENLGHSMVLMDDVNDLLQNFVELTDASQFRLLLASITHDMCRRFHTDMNYLRLLCTYIGPGTLWVPDAAVNRHALHHGGSNEQIVTAPNSIQQAATGHVLVLKGECYPNAVAAVHRSPELSALDEPRLLLRIDTNE